MCRSPFIEMNQWVPEHHLFHPNSWKPSGECSKPSSDNGLSLIRRQAVIYTDAGILLTELTYSEFWTKIQLFSYQKIGFKLSFSTWWTRCLGPDVLTNDAMLAWLSDTTNSVDTTHSFTYLFSPKICFLLSPGMSTQDWKHWDRINHIRFKGIMCDRF